MKKFLASYQQTFGILNYVTFLLLLVSLAFPWKFTQPLFTIWLVAWFLEGRWFSLRNWRMNRSTVPVLLLCGFVLWEALSLLWTQDISSGKSELERHLPVFAILLVALFGGNEHYKGYQMKTAWIAGSLLSIACYGLVCYEHACTGTLESNPPFWYINSPWTLFGEGPVNILKHRSHYCIVLLMSLIYSIDVYRHFRTRYSALGTGIVIGIIDIILLMVIILTGSRTAILLLPIVGILLLIINYHGRWRKGFIIGILTTYALLIFVGLSYNARLISAKNDLVRMVSNDEAKQHDTQEPRIAIYSCALRHWNEYGLWGVGFGASAQKMQELYAEDGLEVCLQYRYGIHNRYMKVWMELGPLALIAMLFILFSAPFWHTGQARHDAIMMCLIFGGSMMTENVLTMIGGLYIFFVLTALIQLEQREQDSLPPAHP